MYLVVLINFVDFPMWVELGVLGCRGVLVVDFAVDLYIEGFLLGVGVLELVYRNI
jgi:hypothetical protein